MQGCILGVFKKHSTYFENFYFINQRKSFKSYQKNLGFVLDLQRILYQNLDPPSMKKFLAALLML